MPNNVEIALYENCLLNYPHMDMKDAWIEIIKVDTNTTHSKKEDI